MNLEIILIGCIAEHLNTVREDRCFKQIKAAVYPVAFSLDTFKKICFLLDKNTVLCKNNGGIYSVEVIQYDIHRF